MRLWQRLLNVSFVMLLATTLCYTATVTSAGPIPAFAEDITPLETGDAAPSFSVRTVDDEAYEFDANSLTAPTMLISFRGGWCPYCNMHLSELRNAVPQIRAMGFDILFLSNDRPDLLYSTLEGKTQDDIDGLDYTILSDASLDAARAFGTAFRAPAKLASYLEGKGSGYKGSSIEQFDALAVPSVYIVDTGGEIAFDYVNPNYKVRISAEELLAVANGLASRR